MDTFAAGLTDIPNVILAPRQEHSRKPEEFFALANRLGNALGGARIELFARERRDGWDCWGAEVDELPTLGTSETVSGNIST